MSHSRIYCTDHINARTVCAAIHAGTGYEIVPPAPLQEGGVVMYGFLRGLLPMLQEAQRQGRPWWYVDRGYFRASRGKDFSGYFRITKDAWQHDGRGNFPPGRWRALCLGLAPWRRFGRHVLVVPPSDVFAQAVGGFTAEDWLARTLQELQRHTERPLRVRSKTAQVPLAQDLKECHAVVTYMSNTAVDALLAGVPVFTTGACAATAMGLTDLSQIETPALPENREAWAIALAANQWTLDEIRAGVCKHVFMR